MAISAINLLQSLLDGASVLKGQGATGSTKSANGTGRASLFAQLLGSAQNQGNAASGTAISPLESPSDLSSASLEQALLLALSLGNASGKCPLAKYLRANASGLKTMEVIDGKQGKSVAATLNDLLAQKQKDGTTDPSTWLAAALAALNPAAAQQDSRTVGTRSGDVVVTDSTAASQGNAGANLNALLHRLTNFLRRLADLLETSATDSATPTTPTETTPTVPADTSTAASSDALLRTVAANPKTKTAATEPVLPDLVYISSGADGAANGSSEVQSAAMRVVAVPREGSGSPLEVLRKLIDRIEEKASDADKGIVSTPNPSVHHFLVARADLPASATPIAVDKPLALDPMQAMQAGSRVEAVRQAQAAMADMVDRMSGSVSLDAHHRTAVIHLDPPALGRVHIDLTIDDSQNVAARIAADSPATQDFLRQNQQNLRQGLADQGFKSEKVDIQFTGDEREAFTRWLSNAAYSV